MFVITADQINSRSSDDLAGPVRQRLNAEYGRKLLLPADRTAGDEIQLLTADSRTALALVLDLTRSGQWSVGLGCGTVRDPLPSATREASGDAFFAARFAVTRAKKLPTRFAVETIDDEHESDRLAAHDWPRAEDAESLINLLLDLRGRRSDAGWQLYDLTSTGMPQKEAAAQLGITPPSASSRARAAGLRIEAASIDPLTRLLENLDRSRI